MSDSVVMKKYVRLVALVAFVSICILVYSRHRRSTHSWIKAGKERLETLNAQTLTGLDQSAIARKIKNWIQFSSRLTRKADEIDFDYSLCPSKSLVRTKPKPSFTPKHPDCPDLFIIGTRKGGTTSLIQYLSKHPNFKGPRLDSEEQAGELFYFTTKYNTYTWEKYMSFFPHSPGVLIGESSVGYSTGCVVPQRIVDDCGTKARIVYLLRNPYRRFESNYLMRTRLNAHYHNSNINSVFEHEWELFRTHFDHNRSGLNEQTAPRIAHENACLKSYKGAPNMLYDSLYLIFLSNWLCNYPSPEKIMIMNSEEFFKDPKQTLSELFDFLNIPQLSDDELSSITSSVYNKGSGDHAHNVTLNPKNKERIQGLFEPFTQSLLGLLQWDIDWSY